MNATHRSYEHTLDPRRVSSPRDMNYAIVRIATDRDRVAFADLFAHYGPRLKTFLMRSGSSDSAAEDLVQEVMLTVWRKAHQFDPARATSAAWIYTIARNLRRSDQRRGSSYPHLLDLTFGAEEPERPDTALDAAQSANAVREALRSLNEDQARAIEMAFFGGHTHLAISEALGVPLGTIKARIRFGMIKMRTIVERGGQP